MIRTLLAASLLLSTPALARADDPQAAIRAAMADSAAGWSRGDIRRFMAVYADDAIFVTRDGLVRGKAAIAARYAKGYGADPAARGALSFRILGFRPVDPRHQILFARWQLIYPAGKKPAAGMTTLVFERGHAGWKIISDHSS